MTIERAYKFLTEDIWRHSQNDIRDKRRRYEFSLLKVLTLCAKGFNNKKLNVWANSLTYSLMFAAMPIVAMIIAIANGFGYMDLVRERMYNSFLGEYNMAADILGAAERYLETSHGGLFLGIGFLFFIWAIYSFFTNVEQCFNEIWNVHRSRAVHMQVITYFAILFFMPILFVVSSGMLSLVWNIGDAIGLGSEGWLRNIITAFIPYLTSWLIFSCMYKLIPNTTVSWTASIIPGVVMGTMYQLMQWVLVHFVVILARASVVYGAFATIPMLMMCLQWMCLLILIGTQLSFSIQNNEMFEYEKDIMDISHRYEDFVALYITHAVCEHFRTEQPPLSASELAESYHLPIRLVRQELERLTRAGILYELYTEDDSVRLYHPAKDVALITTEHVEDALDRLGSEEFLRALPSDMKEYWERYKTQKEHNSNINISL